MEAEQIRKLNIDFSKKGIEEKTILFMENYFCGARGVISRIFNEYLVNPVYRDYKLVWLTQDYDATVKKYGAWLDSEKIWLCVKNGYDYVRYLNTAKYIYTADYLPNFYIKREGQEVFFAPMDLLLARKEYKTKAMLWRLDATVNSADHIIADKNAKNIPGFLQRFGHKDVINPSGEKGEGYFIKPRKKVFFSLLNTKRGAKSLETFQYFYGFFTALADAYGYDVYWKLPHSLYNKYLDEEYVSKSYLNVHNTEEESLSFMQQADIVVADTLCDVVSACNVCNHIIYYAAPDDENEDLLFSKDVYKTGGIEMLSDIFEMKLAGKKKISDETNHKETHELFDCPKLLKGSMEHELIKKNVPKAAVKSSAEADDRPDVLIAAETGGFPDMVKELHERLLKYKDKVRITVLYRSASKGVLYNQIQDLSTDISYICRNGVLQCPDEDRDLLTKKTIKSKDSGEPAENTAAVIKDEWLRILGRGDFDHAIAITGVNVFWLNMYNYMPAAGEALYKQKATAKETVDEAEKLLKAYIKKIKKPTGGKKK